MTDKELERMCEYSTYSKVTYCQDYGKPKCPNTCYFAKGLSEQMKKYRFKHELNFDVRVAGE